MTIGIPGSLVGPNSFGIGITYVMFCKHYLGCNDLRILQPDGPVFTDLDLLILTGGADVNPSRYGEVPSFFTDKPDLFKEYFDEHVLPDYIERKTPIFGICRGMQTLAVHFGGKLIQDMWHDTNKSDDPSAGVHDLNILSQTNLKVEVNSRHHQSVKFPREDSPIKVLATHKKYKHHVEAIQIQGYPITAVQFHPEDLDESSGVQYAMKLIDQIVKK